MNINFPNFMALFGERISNLWRKHKTGPFIAMNPQPSSEVITSISRARVARNRCRHQGGPRRRRGQRLGSLTGPRDPKRSIATIYFISECSKIHLTWSAKDEMFHFLHFNHIIMFWGRSSDWPINVVTCLLPHPPQTSRQCDQIGRFIGLWASF